MGGWRQKVEVGLESQIENARGGDDAERGVGWGRVD